MCLKLDAHSYIEHFLLTVGKGVAVLSSFSPCCFFKFADVSCRFNLKASKKGTVVLCLECNWLVKKFEMHVLNLMHQFNFS